MQLGNPHLFGNEQALLERCLKGSKNYLEFGLGGSSLLAAKLGVSTIVAVDSDPEWVTSVSESVEISARIADGSMSILHADIGPVLHWGSPVSRDHVEKWPNYIATAWAEWTRRQSLPDLVFVDGRFRIACCLSVVIAFCSAPHPPPVVLLHDFGPSRPQYRELLQFFELDLLVDSLACLRLRPRGATSAALSHLLARQFDIS